MSTSTKDVHLTDEQLTATATLLRLEKPVQTLGGYAGTGKTTVIRHLLAQLRGWAVCAYTGKAAHVLRQKGVPATTIHSLIYIPDRNVQTGKRTWRLNNAVVAKGVIVDEASMVSASIYRDLLALRKPLIFVGDHGQLEPVESERYEGQPFNLMATPDLTLETIHRNAGEIAHFAEFVRKGNSPSNWLTVREYDEQYATPESRRVELITRDESMPLLEELITSEQPSSFQVICALNKTRVAWNSAIREVLGREGPGPAVGDRVMCLENNREHSLFNGMQGRVSGVIGNNLRFTSDDGDSCLVQYDADAFNAVKKPEQFFRSKDVVPFDYAWVVTCHKAQGSEWDKVFVIEQRCAAWDHARWAYTAASRAKERLYWIAG